MRSGSGSTGEGCDVDNPNCASLTGLGNLIVGYNEPEGLAFLGRTGSHNLVVGSHHGFTSFGGFVAGLNNAVTGAGSSVIAGGGNEARGSASSVTGRALNVASGPQSSVSGGRSNLAAGSSSPCFSPRGGLYAVSKGTMRPMMN